MTPRWPQDGPKTASWRVLGPLGGQDGPKMEPRGPKMEPRGLQGRKSQFVPPMLGPKLGPNFGHFNYRSGLQEASRTTLMTCWVQTQIFKRKWLSQDTLWTPKIQPKCCTVVKNQFFSVFHSKWLLEEVLGGFLGRFWDPSWGQVGPCWAPSWLKMAMQHDIQKTFKKHEKRFSREG